MAPGSVAIKQRGKEVEVRAADHRSTVAGGLLVFLVCLFCLVHGGPEDHSPHRRDEPSKSKAPVTVQLPSTGMRCKDKHRLVHIHTPQESAVSLFLLFMPLSFLLNASLPPIQGRIQLVLRETYDFAGANKKQFHFDFYLLIDLYQMSDIATCFLRSSAH